MQAPSNHVCKIVGTSGFFWEEELYLSKGCEKAKSYRSGLYGTSRGWGRGGTDSAEGGAPWFLDPSGTAIDQAEVGGRATSLSIFLEDDRGLLTPKGGSPCLQRGWPWIENGVWSLLGMREPPWSDLGGL